MLFIDPNDAIAYRYLGVALAKSGKRAEALENYQHALQLNPDTAAVHYSMGILFIEEGKPNAAIEHFRQASLLDPGLVAAHFQLANLLMRKGENREAAKEYALVFDMAPQNALARLMQPMALIHAGDYSEARRILEQAATAFPSDPDIANVRHACSPLPQTPLCATRSARCAWCNPWCNISKATLSKSA